MDQMRDAATEGKFPAMQPNYESSSIDNLFYGETLVWHYGYTVRPQLSISLTLSNGTNVCG